MTKLSGVLYSERSEGDNLRHALKLMKRVIDKWRKNAEAHFIKGKIYVKLGEGEEAIASVEKSIEICLNDPL